MGKGARNRGKSNRRRPHDSLAAFMAPDVPLPPRETREWAAQILAAGVSGQLLMMHYLASVDDVRRAVRRAGVPADSQAPQGDDETDEAYRNRRELDTLMANYPAMGPDWRPQVTDELLHIQPSDAAAAVEMIVRTVWDWAKASEYTSLIEPHVPAMAVLLDALMPPERRHEADRYLEGLCQPNLEGQYADVERAGLRIMGVSQTEPFVGLHVAAAFAAALYLVPECVPNRPAAVLAITESAHSVLDR